VLRPLEVPIEAINVLRETPLFRDFSLGELHLCYAIGVEQGLPPGRLLGLGGELLESMWVLLEGRLEIHSPLAGGRISYASGPFVWGVSALVAPGRPHATAVTASECRLLEIPAEGLRRLCDDNPRFGRRMFEAVAVHVLGRLNTFIEEARP